MNADVEAPVRFSSGNGELSSPQEIDIIINVK